MTDTTAPRTAAAEPERPDRPVLMSAELMDSLVTRDARGNRLHVAWGEPDEAGFYSPTVSVDFTDNIATEAAREAIEPLLALVRAAQRWEGLEVSRRITDYGDAYYDDLEQSAGEAATALIETVRALPESVRVAARKPE